jgi:hypothetical protein
MYIAHGAYGSGGGGPGGGIGGGRINITAVNIFVEGSITADGTVPSNSSAGFGSGAGGTIVLLAQSSLGGMGVVSASGGAAAADGTYAGGGGGRIALYYQYLLGPWGQAADTYLLATGGLLPENAPITAELPVCLLGGAGTVFLQQRIADPNNASSILRYNQLRIDGGNEPGSLFGLAVTPLEIVFQHPNRTGRGTSGGSATPIPVPDPFANPAAPTGTSWTVNSDGTASFASPSFCGGKYSVNGRAFENCVDDTIGIDALSVTTGAVLATSTVVLRRVYAAVEGISMRKVASSHRLQSPFSSTESESIERLLHTASSRNVTLTQRNALRTSLAASQVQADQYAYRMTFGTVGLSLAYKAVLLPLSYAGIAPSGGGQPVVGVMERAPLSPNITIAVAELEISNARIATDLTALIISCSNSTIGSGASISYVGVMSLIADHSLDLEGTIVPLQSLPVLAAEAGMYGFIHVYLGLSAELKGSAVHLSSGEQLVLSGRVMSTTPQFVIDDICSQSVTRREDCAELVWQWKSQPLPPPSNYTVQVSAPFGTVAINYLSQVLAHVGLLCAQSMTLSGRFSSSGLGCAARFGPGAGFPGNNAGGGGGHGGDGGDSADGGKGGRTYDSPVFPLYAGSGGGSSLGIGGTGGGYLKIVAAASATINSYIPMSADGLAATASGGGGAGGSITILTSLLEGAGDISASGGHGMQLGGGAGGGFVSLVAHPILDCNSVNCSDQHFWEVRNHLRTADWIGEGELDYYHRLVAARTRSLPQPYGTEIAQYFYGEISVTGGQGAPGAENGSPGSFEAPPCPPGMGGLPRCTPCGPGFYRNGSSDDQPYCLACNNKPSEAIYAESYQTTPDCAYVCPAGRLYPSCESPFEEILALFGGLRGFALVVSGACLLVLLLLLILCRRRMMSLKALKVLEGIGVAGSDVHTPGKGSDGPMSSRLLSPSKVPSYGSTRSTTKKRPMDVINKRGLAIVYDVLHGSLDDAAAHDSQGHREAPVSTPKQMAKLVTGRVRMAGKLWATQNLIDMLITNTSIQEVDIPRHLRRVYCSGTNIPGNPWQFPEEPPAGVLRLVHASRYRAFMAESNKAMAWSPWGFDSCVHMLLAIVFLPAAHFFLKWRRRKRVLWLMKLLFGGSNPWLRHSKQSALDNAIRFGVSADLSVAFIDFLSPQGQKQDVDAPQSPVSTTPRTPSIRPSLNFPLLFAFSGEGTYSRPYFLDGNDELMRALPATPGLRAFIDETWIDFIAECNTRIRLIHVGAEYQTAGPLLSLLAVVNNAELLGGLRFKLVRIFPGAQSSFSSSEAPTSFADAMDADAIGVEHSELRYNASTKSTSDDFVDDRDTFRSKTESKRDPKPELERFRDDSERRSGIFSIFWKTKVRGATASVRENRAGSGKAVSPHVSFASFSQDFVDGRRAQLALLISFGDEQALPGESHGLSQSSMHRSPRSNQKNDQFSPAADRQAATKPRDIPGRMPPDRDDNDVRSTQRQAKHGMSQIDDDDELFGTSFGSSYKSAAASSFAADLNAGYFQFAVQGDGDVHAVSLADRQNFHENEPTRGRNSSSMALGLWDGESADNTPTPIGGRLGGGGSTQGVKTMSRSSMGSRSTMRLGDLALGPVVTSRGSFRHPWRTCGDTILRSMRGVFDIGGADDAEGQRLDLSLPTPGLEIVPPEEILGWDASIAKPFSQQDMYFNENDEFAAHHFDPENSDFHERVLHSATGLWAHRQLGSLMDYRFPSGHPESLSRMMRSPPLSASGMYNDSGRGLGDKDNFAIDGTVMNRAGSQTSRAALPPVNNRDDYWHAGITMNKLWHGRSFQKFMNRIMFVGSNCLVRRAIEGPTGWAAVFFTGTLCLVLIADLALSLAIAIGLWCVEDTAAVSANGQPITGDGNAQCDYLPVIMYFVLPPLGNLGPACLGLAALAAQSPTGLRLHLRWQSSAGLFSALNSLLFIWLNINYLGATLVGCAGGLSCAKIVGIFFVGPLLASMDDRRDVRSWRGLYHVKGGPVERTNRRLLARLK